jgi:hypothetical protein
MHPALRQLQGGLHGQNSYIGPAQDTTDGLNDYARCLEVTTWPQAQLFLFRFALENVKERTMYVLAHIVAKYLAKKDGVSLALLARLVLG